MIWFTILGDLLVVIGFIDRQHLSENGLLIVVVTFEKHTNQILAGPDIVSRGFVYVRESENLMDDVKEVVNTEVMRCMVVISQI